MEKGKNCNPHGVNIGGTEERTATMWIRYWQLHRSAEDIQRYEINPDHYRKVQREIRNAKIRDAIGFVALFVMGIFMLKLWFVIEGFTVQW